jgi:hypothetical protein
LKAYDVDPVFAEVVFEHGPVPPNAETTYVPEHGSHCITTFRPRAWRVRTRFPREGCFF